MFPKSFMLFVVRFPIGISCRIPSVNVGLMACQLFQLGQPLLATYHLSFPRQGFAGSFYITLSSE